MKRNAIFLGHTVSNKDILPEASKGDEIVNFFTSSCASDANSGMTSLFSKFISSFFVYAAYLFDLLKKGRNFVWSDESRKSFDYIKLKFRDPALLAHPIFDRSFVLQSYNSDKAIGFMLGQQHDGQLRPIMFGGRVVIDIEQRYAQKYEQRINKAVLTCCFALKRCEVYILGDGFIVCTDHKPLLCLSAFKDVLNKRFEGFSAWKV